METRINTIKYARHLRKRLKELKHERGKEAIRYNRAIEEWKKNLLTWIQTHAKDRVNKILVRDLESRYGEKQYYKLFFCTAPEPPKRKQFPEIRDIEGLLRHLAITGSQTVTVRTDEVKKLMIAKDPDNNEDDE